MYASACPGSPRYLSTSDSICISAIGVFSTRKSMASCRLHPLACRPVSTTSRPARMASIVSMPSLDSSLLYRPISSARRSQYSAQPSPKALIGALRRTTGRSSSSAYLECSKWCPGTASWYAVASSSILRRFCGSLVLTKYVPLRLPSSAAGR